VARRGWTGWTGEGTAKGRARRTRVIYETNLRASYAAGRWAQIQQVKAARPYLLYRHNDNVLHPRPLHVSWNGLVIKADDPWWQTHFPPNGWGCQCRVHAVDESYLRQQGKAGPDVAPDDGTYDWTDKASGKTFRDIPNGVDPGWDYAPGASVADELGALARAKGTTLAESEASATIAKSYIQALVNHDQFLRFFAGRLGGEYPVAVLDAETRQALATEQALVMLSRETIDTHDHHPEIGASDYRLAQRIVDEGELYRQDQWRILALWRDGGRLYRAALKRTMTGDKNYWLTLFPTTEDLANIQVREKYPRIKRALQAEKG